MTSGTFRGPPSSSQAIITFTDARVLWECWFLDRYRGTAVDGLRHTLETYDRKFDGGKYYAKYASVVQSSGTGKTKTVVEVSTPVLIP